MNETITWIKISDHLPPNDDTVLICQSDGVHVASYDGEWWGPGSDFTFDGSGILYWAELPKGPGKS